MAWVLSELAFPPAQPEVYLGWASWWHGVEQELIARGTSPSPDDDAPEVLGTTSLWDELLTVISREASRALLTRDRTIFPAVRASRPDVAIAARIGRARLEWLRHAVVEQESLRPDKRVAHLNSKILAMLERTAGLAQVG